MVDETIRSIKEAEQQAEEILVKAQEQKEQKKSQKNDAQQKHPAKKKNRSGDAR